MTTAPTPPTGERRPIKTREQRWAQRLASWCAARNFSPNGISIAGMIAGIAAGVALAATAWAPEASRLFWLLGALLVQMRLVANMLDGMVALETGRASPVGEIYNEAPDRVSDLATLAGLGYAVGGHGELGLAVGALAVFVAYIRAMGTAMGARTDFCGPMAKQHRMFIVTAISLFCGLAPAAWQGPWMGLGLPAWGLLIIGVGCIVTAWRRLSRIAAQLRGGEGPS